MTTPPKTWPRRLLRFALWSLATLISLYILLCVWLKWSGARAYARLQASLTAAGETTEFRALLPPPIAPARNFFTLDPLLDISRVEDRDPSKGTPAKKRQALERMKVLQTSQSQPPLSATGVKAGTPFEFHALTEWFRTTKVIPVPDKPVLTADDVRNALERAFPEIVQFAAAVDTHLEAAFVPSLSERPLPDDLMTLAVPQYSTLMAVNLPLQWHGLASNTAGDGDAALRNVRVLLRFSEACKREPMLIGLLVAASEQSVALDLLWHVLRERKAGEESLRKVQNELSRSWEEPSLQGFRGELAAAASTARSLEQAAGGDRARMMSYVNQDGASNTGSFGSACYSLLPTGLLALNGAHLVQAELDTLVLPMKRGGLRGLIKESEAHNETLKKIKNSPLTHMNGFLTAMMLPAIDGFSHRMIITETLRKQAVIACALERWHLTHHSYPESLQALVPQFLPEVPTDVLDGKLIRYRQTSDGRYAIWATGFDGKDDNGLVTTKAGIPAGDIYKPGYQGDWAWQYQPVKQ